MDLPATLALVQFTVSLLVSTMVTRRMRGRRVPWFALPASALIPAGILALVTLLDGVPMVSAATGAGLATFGLLGCACGVATGLRGQPRWNLRRSWGVSMAVMLVAVEIAILAAWWGSTIAPDHAGSPAVVLLAGAALALAASRRGATPESAQWTRRLRYGTSLTVILALGAWWFRAEALSWVIEPHALSADHSANASTLAGWILPAGLAMAMVPALVSLRLSWVKRLGPLLLAAAMLVMPMVLGGLIVVDNAACGQHRPTPNSFAERLQLQRTLDEAPWCRSTPEYYPVCEDETSRWDRQQDHWSVLGNRFHGPDTQQPLGKDTLHREHLPLRPGLVYKVTGRWEVPELEAGLREGIANIAACLEQETRTVSVSVFISPSGQTGVARNTTSPEEETCIEEVLERIELPEPGCEGVASFTTTLERNIGQTDRVTGDTAAK